MIDVHVIIMYLHNTQYWKCIYLSWGMDGESSNISQYAKYIVIQESHIFVTITFGLNTSIEMLFIMLNQHILSKILGKPSYYVACDITILYSFYL